MGSASDKWFTNNPKWPKRLKDEAETRLWVQNLRDKDKQRLIRSLQAFPPVKGPKLIVEESPLVNVTSEAEDESAAYVGRPSNRDLYLLAFQQSLPFIGFGFLDNLIMILAGEYIDHHIGLTLGISTMAAAALGNTISDLFGIASGGYIEHFCAKIGVSAPSLTLEQLDLSVTRAAGYAGRAIGIVIGCILGMAPLLF